MATHKNYWSCSPLADWLRGTKKLSAGTSEQWDSWRTEAKTKHRFRFWLAEQALGNVQDFVTWPVRKLYDVKYYINNRWVTRTHALTAHSRDIKPGEWCDVGNRFLPCLFNELVDFVEIEQAWATIAWADEQDKAKYNPPFWATGWWRWRTWRCAQAGLDHLDWAMSLTNSGWCAPDHPEHNRPSAQAITAREIKELYVWWTVTYPNRPDPMTVSGWSDYCDRMQKKYPSSFMGMMSRRDTEDAVEGRRISERLSEIEAEYEAEETKMLKRLIDVRKFLWT